MGTLRTLLTSTALLLVVLMASPAASQEPEDSPIAWVADYDTARELSRQQQKPVFLFLTSDGCRFCKKMQSEALTDPSVIRQAQAAFVPTKLRIDPDSPLAKALKVRIFPTTVIISPDGKIVDYARGYLPTNDLVGRMKQAVADVQVAANGETSSR